MTFTKSNINFAKKHNIDLDINLEGGNVLFFKQGEDENFLEYVINAEGTTLTFKCQVYGDKIEDLPAHITSAKQLNEVVKYLASVEL